MNVCTLSLQPPFFLWLCKRVRVLMASKCCRARNREEFCLLPKGRDACLRLAPGVVAVDAVDQEGLTGEM